MNTTESLSSTGAAYSIGQFASYGRVSVRMLRHYDAIGLLTPYRVDPSSGYRSYAGSQFSTLARIVALREQGFGLEQIRTILDDVTPLERVAQLFRERADELRAALDADGRRLASVEETIGRLEGTTTMTTTESTKVEIKSVPGSLVYVARSTAEGFGPEFIGPVVGPLFNTLADALLAAGLTPDLPAVAWYVSEEDDAGRVQVNAAFSAAPGAQPGAGYEVVDLPAIETAAVLVHKGPPDTIGEAWMRLTEWMAREGWAPSGPCREIYLSSNEVPMEDWVTELHYPVRAER